MTQDDAHIFCTKEQMVPELKSLLDFVLDLLRDYGLTDFYLELSTKPPGKAVGTDEEWAEATETLRAAAEQMDLETLRQRVIGELRAEAEGRPRKSRTRQILDDNHSASAAAGVSRRR